MWKNHKERKIGFKLAKQELINYAKKNNTLIPSYFESIILLLE